MRDILKEILLDSQETPFFTGTSRNIAIEQIPGKASICMGVRRSGKSTFMHQMMAKLEADGISRTNIVNINFFDDRLHFLREKGLSEITEAYYSLYPEKKGSETVYFFFDEIQTFAGWEQFVERLMRTEKCELYITGSSAQMLSREIATQMRGRSISWEMFPFSFGEYLDSIGIEHAAPFSTKKRLLIQKGFEHYWRTGGFPEVTPLSDHLRVKVHQEYFQTILYRDLVDRHDISHPKALRDLAHQLIDNAGSLHSQNSLYGFLKSLNHKINKSNIGQYLEWMEDSYFLFSVRLFDASLSRSNANAKKIYCIDHSLVTSISSGILLNAGHLLENLIFIALRRKSPDIFYYRTESGKEVDFIVILNRNAKILVQVCETLADPKTRKRETIALHEAMPECGLQESIIVTRNESETIITEFGSIKVIPAWQFLLEME